MKLRIFNVKSRSIIVSGLKVFFSVFTILFLFFITTDSTTGNPEYYHIKASSSHTEVHYLDRYDFITNHHCNTVSFRNVRLLRYSMSIQHFQGSSSLSVCLLETLKKPTRNLSDLTYTAEPTPALRI